MRETGTKHPVQKIFAIFFGEAGHFANREACGHRSCVEARRWREFRRPGRYTERAVFYGKGKVWPMPCWVGSPFCFLRKKIKLRRYYSRERTLKADRQWTHPTPQLRTYLASPRRAKSPRGSACDWFLEHIMYIVNRVLHNEPLSHVTNARIGVILPRREPIVMSKRWVN